MKYLSFLLALLVFGLAHGTAATLDERLSQAIDILANRQGSTSAIPQSLFKNCKGVAIVKVTKAGLVFGGAGGQGVLTVKNGSSWSAPSCFNVSGGSFGAQIGVETKRFILVINSDDALKLFTGEGETKWDATAAGTVGADAVHESESDLAKLPIVVYSDSEGVFGGATFGGTTINVDKEENHSAYGANVYVRDIVGGKVKSPESAKRLYDLLNGKR